MSEVLRVQNLTYMYGRGTPFEVKALNNVTFSVSDGEFIAIMGHTGSGKSTLVQHLNGLLKPTSGTVSFQTEDIWKTPGLIKRIKFEVGLVFQYPEYQLFEETIEKDIAFGPKNMRFNQREITKRVKYAAEFVGLDEKLLNKSPFELSGGQCRRAAIAGIIAMTPRVLVLDEPTAGLDPAGSRELLERIKTYASSGERAVILVTHSMEAAAEVATRFIVMQGGRIVKDGSKIEIFSDKSLLENAGLEAPQAARIADRLISLGIPLSGKSFTVRQLADEIKKLLGVTNND